MSEPVPLPTHFFAVPLLTGTASFYRTDASISDDDRSMPSRSVTCSPMVQSITNSVAPSPVPSLLLERSVSLSRRNSEQTVRSISPESIVTPSMSPMPAEAWVASAVPATPSVPALSRESSSEPESTTSKHPSIVSLCIYSRIHFLNLLVRLSVLGLAELIAAQALMDMFSRNDTPCSPVHVPRSPARAAVKKEAASVIPMDEAPLPSSSKLRCLTFHHRHAGHLSAFCLISHPSACLAVLFLHSCQQSGVSSSRTSRAGREASRTRSTCTQEQRRHIWWVSVVAGDSHAHLSSIRLHSPHCNRSLLTLYCFMRRCLPLRVSRLSIDVHTELQPLATRQGGSYGHSTVQVFILR
jgi:hypothetical protein